MDSIIFLSILGGVALFCIGYPIWIYFHPTKEENTRRYTIIDGIPVPLDDE